MRIFPDFLVNEFKQIFKKDQEKLLNMGLNLALQQQSLPKKQIVIDIEAGIQFESKELKEATRNNVAGILSSHNKPAFKELQIVQRHLEKLTMKCNSNLTTAPPFKKFTLYDDNVIHGLGAINLLEIRNLVLL